MPGSIRSMHLEHVFRDVQTDRANLLHGRLLWWQFDTATLARRCRRGASTPSPLAQLTVQVIGFDVTWPSGGAFWQLSPVAGCASGDCARPSPGPANQAASNAHAAILMCDGK